MRKKNDQEKPFDLFKDKFEGEVKYKDILDNSFKAKKVRGVIQIISKGSNLFVLVFDLSDLIIPKEIIPYHSIIDITVSEDIEKEAIEEDFNLYDTVKATIIEDGNQKSSLDVESKIEIGTDSIGDIEITNENENDITY